MTDDAPAVQAILRDAAGRVLAFDPDLAADLSDLANDYAGPYTPEETGDNQVSADRFVLIYDNRSDGGPRHVGPFSSRAEAEGHADSLAAPGWQASYSVVRLTPPEKDGVRPERFAGPPISAWSPASWELS